MFEDNLISVDFYSCLMFDCIYAKAKSSTSHTSDLRFAPGPYNLKHFVSYL